MALFHKSRYSVNHDAEIGVNVERIYILENGLFTETPLCYRSGEPKPSLNERYFVRTFMTAWSEAILDLNPTRDLFDEWRQRIFHNVVLIGIHSSLFRVYLLWNSIQ